MKNKLPDFYKNKINEKFGKAKIECYKNIIDITPEGECDNYLTFESFKFLADLFKTDKVTSGIFISQTGCPTCGSDDERMVTFTIKEAKIT